MNYLQITMLKSRSDSQNIKQPVEHRHISQSEWKLEPLKQRLVINSQHSANIPNECQHCQRAVFYKDIIFTHHDPVT